MKRLLILVAFAALAVLLLGAAPAQAQATFTEFSGTSSLIGPVAMGEWTVLPNGRIRIRGYSEAYNDVMSDPRVSGVNTLVINANFSAGFAGRMWGTSIIQNGGGSWDMVWEGVRTKQGFSYITGVGHGRGGYEGLRAKWYGQRLDPNPAAPWQFTGVILEP